MALDCSELDLLFGSDSIGSTAEERAKSSKKLFVRSQDHLALYSSNAKGHVLTAWEAYQSYSIDTLKEVFEKGSAILADTIDEPSATLKKRREQLGLSLNDIAKYAQISDEEARDILDIENPQRRKSIHLLEKIAITLGLDERLISYKPGSGGDEHLSGRLKEFRDQPTTCFSPKTVLAFHEAAWVIFTEDRLRCWIKNSTTKPKWQSFEPSHNYGTVDYPAWRHGYYLAQDTRKKLNLGDGPIKSFRDLFRLLDLPLVHIDITERIAGATLASGESRGVVINIKGANDNVWIRRVTMAHELGHLLWDPNPELKNIRVDEYHNLEEDTTTIKDSVEQRANAFAVEFLVPGRIAKEIYLSFNNKSDAIKKIMSEYGISYTSACHHIKNALDNPCDFAKPEVNCLPTDDWEGREKFTEKYFPIKETKLIRSGNFAGLVTKAENIGLISKNTASEYLNCTEDKYDSAKNSILEIYPDKS